MTNILILEDDKAGLQTLKRMIEKMTSEIQVMTAQNLEQAEKLLLSKKNVFEAFFLDINLDEKNEDDQSGITFAKMVRSKKEYAFTPIVMITSIANLELQAYRKLHCYQYILKPYHEEEIKKLISKILFQKGETTDVSLIVKIEGINYKIFSKDIVYLKAITRGVCLVMANEELNVPYTSIRQMLEKLPKDRFFQCHRMYVINQDYIDYVDYVNGIIKMTMCGEVELGVTYKNEVRSRMDG